MLFPAGFGDGVEEGLGVRVAGRWKMSRTGGFFDDAPGVHDQDAVADPGRRPPRVVGDEDDRGAEAALEVLHEREDLGLDVTSRAVVGSSAMRICGSQQRAMAIMTRWRMPPESWWGYSSMRFSGLGISTSLSISMTRFRRAAASSCVVVLEGLVDLPADAEDGVEGRSWAPGRSSRCAPRGSPRICSGVQSARFTGASARRCGCVSSARAAGVKIISEPDLMMLVRSGRSRMMDLLVTVLPHPDSPTMPRVSPAKTLNDTSSTAGDDAAGRCGTAS